jgi:creatinine amidohydrolase
MTRNNDSECLYEAMTPEQFLKHLQECPVAYLPLGTLEWHGPHNPLGADGLQSELFFRRFAAQYGGIVLPKLFLGPDRRKKSGAVPLYGMDFCTHDAIIEYKDQKLPGSAYWTDDALFDSLLKNIAAQLKRAGFEVLVAHGHGPSTKHFQALHEEFRRAGIRSLTLFDLPLSDDLKFQNDHAAANETSILLALCPELVHMENLERFPETAMAGKDPLRFASREYGMEIIRANQEVLSRQLDILLQRK